MLRNKQITIDWHEIVQKSTEIWLCENFMEIGNNFVNTVLFGTILLSSMLLVTSVFIVFGVPFFFVDKWS